MGWRVLSSRAVCNPRSADRVLLKRSTTYNPIPSFAASSNSVAAPA